MKHMRTDKERLDHLIASFNLLSEKDQIYLENLASELAEMHKTAPETGICPHPAAGTHPDRTFRPIKNK